VNDRLFSLYVAMIGRYRPSELDAGDLAEAYEQAMHALEAFDRYESRRNPPIYPLPSAEQEQ
jgi:hypothetical protein